MYHPLLTLDVHFPLHLLAFMQLDVIARDNSVQVQCPRDNSSGVDGIACICKLGHNGSNLTFRFARDSSGCVSCPVILKFSFNIYSFFN